MNNHLQHFPELSFQQLTHRDARVYGHNGLVPGQWFISRESARHWGAHSETECGVAPGSDGAYAIVVTDEDRTYAPPQGKKKLNSDQDDTILYAQTGATKAFDPNAVPTHSQVKRYMEALRASSYEPHNPIRVFRGSTRLPDTNAPSFTQGFRYDGLYQIVGPCTIETNTNNEPAGIFEQWTLQRLPETIADPSSMPSPLQPSLVGCKRLAELRGYKEGFPSDMEAWYQHNAPQPFRSLTADEDHRDFGCKCSFSNPDSKRKKKPVESASDNDLERLGNAGSDQVGSSPKMGETDELD